VLHEHAFRHALPLTRGTVRGRRFRCREQGDGGYAPNVPTTGRWRSQVRHPGSAPRGPRRRGVGGGGRLLVALADGPAEADLAVVDPDVEPALGIGAHPRLVGDGRSIASVVRERQHLAVLTLPALRELSRRRHRSSPPLSRVSCYG